MNECSICLEKINHPFCLVCAHIFCGKCIITLIKKRWRKCPICRTRITWTIPAITKAHPELFKIDF